MFSLHCHFKTRYVCTHSNISYINTHSQLERNLNSPPTPLAFVPSKFSNQPLFALHLLMPLNLASNCSNSYFCRCTSNNIIFTQKRTQSLFPLDLCPLLPSSCCSKSWPNVVDFTVLDIAILHSHSTLLLPGNT